MINKASFMLKMESEFIVDRPAIQNSQWLNYTLQLIPKQVLNMSTENVKNSR